LLYLLSRAENSFDVCVGSLRADIWNQEVAYAIERRLRDKPKLRVRILTGPVLDGFVNETHPALEMLQSLRAKEFDIAFRRLKRYPIRGQGKHADGNLYVTMQDGRKMQSRPFVAFYREYVPRPDRVEAWVQKFDALWDDADLQLDGPAPVEWTVPLQ
jgi:hypothetical protein